MPNIEAHDVQPKHVDKNCEVKHESSQGARKSERMNVELNQRQVQVENDEARNVAHETFSMKISQIFYPRVKEKCHR